MMPRPLRAQIPKARSRVDLIQETLPHSNSHRETCMERLQFPTFLLLQSQDGSSALSGMEKPELRGVFKGK